MEILSQSNWMILSCNKQHDLILKKTTASKTNFSFHLLGIIAFILAAEGTLKSLVSTSKKKQKSGHKHKAEENISGL